jgi:hypothetical protein
MGLSDVRKVEIHTAEPLVPKSCPSWTETGIEKLKRRKSSPDDEAAAELTGAGEVKHYVLSSINLFILFGITKNCLII